MILEGYRKEDIYVASFDYANSVCLSISFDTTFMWHRRSGHVNIILLQKLASHELVAGLPKCLVDTHTHTVLNLLPRKNDKKFIQV